MIHPEQINRWFFKNQARFNQLADGFIYLNNGTEGSMPDCVVDSFKESLTDWGDNPTVSYETDSRLGKLQTHTRRQLAEFFDTDASNICLTNNTTMGLSMALTGLSFRAGDRVITTDHEHPAIISPLWMAKQRQGIDVIVRAFPDHTTLSKMNPDELLDHLFPVTPQLQSARALCVSHVYNTHGVRLPLDKLQRRVQELGIDYLIVDGAQAAGMVDLYLPENRVDNCDFYAAPMHKWMNGPPGAGILYIRNPYLGPPEFYPTLSQKMGDYMCVDDSGEPQPVTDALQVRGCQNTPSYNALLKLLQLYREMGGQEVIQDYIFGLAESVRNFIASKSPKSLISPSHKDLQSGLISFFPFDWNNPDHYYTSEEKSLAAASLLLKKGIQVRYIAFPTVVYPKCLSHRHLVGQAASCSEKQVGQRYCIRVSTGLFNTMEQIEAFKIALKETLCELASGKHSVIDTSSQQLACCC